ncbi:MAG: metallophosphoesterase [Archangium sp.]|nr:metallophosphoesterase [Archangium sp.]MDP3151979.1 metallophosphoesterase [Archangium sp.]MDP3571392.1 metallophosphoesterase [Archangium sp.]
MRIIHVSDIHHQLDWGQRSWGSSGWQGVLGRIELHTFGRLHRFSDGSRAWNNILEDIEKLDADHVLFTGDLTAMGAGAEFEAVHASVRHLTQAGRLTVIPGNHDRYIDAPGARHFERVFAEQLVSAMPEYADATGYPFVKLLGDDTAIIGLDSTRVSGWSHYFVGRLGRSQLDALQKILDDPRLAKRTVHVLSHHNPVSHDGRREGLQTGLLDGARFLDIIENRDVMLHHGHSHVRSWHRAGDERPHLFGGGSSTEPGREGYWMIDVEDHRTLEAAHFRPGRERAPHHHR